MTCFIDGPLKGKVLALKTSPEFLRAVQNSRGAFDALDLETDTPRSDERIYVYRLKKKLGTAHINLGNRGGGWYPIAEYEYHEHQFSDARLRNEWPEIVKELNTEMRHER